MSWGASLLLAFAAAICALISGGVVANKAVGWLRISSREGASGYFVIYLALFAGVGGFFVALFVAHYAGEENGFLAFAWALAAVLGIIFFLGLMAWLSADSAPRVKGKALALQLEIRAQAGRQFVQGNSNQLYVYLSASKAAMRMAEMRFDGIQRVDGLSTLTGQVPLHTSRDSPYLCLGGEIVSGATVHFPITLAPPLDPARHLWSPWLDGQPVGQNPPLAARAFQLRYRLIFADEIEK